MIIAYIILSIFFLIYSYGFVDVNLHLSNNYFYTTLHQPLQYLVFEKRGWAGLIYVLFLCIYWFLFYLVLKKIDQKKISFTTLKKLIVIVGTIFVLSFPAFSYDIFNYILTAKVTFTYKENPWIIRPVEIPNEPSLQYTRAANKVALYGPTWILLTWFPHVLGMGNIWITIITFKVLILIFYIMFIGIVWRVTKNIWNIAVFALNPLVLFEILNDGHNDIVMMVFICASLMLLSVRKSRNFFYSLTLFVSSFLVKGATIVLFPFYIFRNRELDFYFKGAFWLLFIVFLLSPFREEMYPWYFTWCLCFVVLLPKKNRFMYIFSLSMCFGLLLRNLPYIVTRQYAGYNQIIRMAVTWIPVSFFILYRIWKKISSND